MFLQCVKTYTDSESSVLMVFTIWISLQRLENTFFGPHDSSRIPVVDFQNSSALGNLDLT